MKFLSTSRQQPEILQLVSSLSVSGPLGWARMALLTRHLDDDPVLVEQEVDARHMSAVDAEDDLLTGRREACSAHQLQESSLEVRVAARVGDHVLDESAPPASRAP